MADLETVCVVPFHCTGILPDGIVVIHTSPMQNRSHTGNLQPSQNARGSGVGKMIGIWVSTCVVQNDASEICDLRRDWNLMSKSRRGGVTGARSPSRDDSNNRTVRDSPHDKHV